MAACLSTLRRKVSAVATPPTWIECRDDASGMTPPERRHAATGPLSFKWLFYAVFVVGPPLPTRKARALSIGQRGRVCPPRLGAALPGDRGSRQTRAPVERREAAPHGRRPASDQTWGAPPCPRTAR